MPFDTASGMLLLLQGFAVAALAGAAVLGTLVAGVVVLRGCRERLRRRRWRRWVERMVVGRDAFKHRRH